MPYIQIIAGLTIQAGTLMIQAGMNKVIPEIEKLIDEPGLEDTIKDLEINKLITKAVADISKKKGLRT